MKNKYWVIILILLVIAVVVGIYFLKGKDSTEVGNLRKYGKSQ